jgi:hypothetical protein
MISFAGGTYKLSEMAIGGDCGTTSNGVNAFDNAITLSITPTRFVEVGKRLFASELTGTRQQVATPRANALALGCHGWTYTYDVLAVRRA